MSYTQFTLVQDGTLSMGLITFEILRTAGADTVVGSGIYDSERNIASIVFLDPADQDLEFETVKAIEEGNLTIA